MKDVKWSIKRYGSFIVLTAVIIITGSIALGKRDTERNTEEVRESPVVIENTEAVKEDESVECFEEESPNPAEALTGEKPEPVSILTAEEEQDLQDEAISAARQCMDLYKEIEIVYPETAYSYMKSFSEKQRKDVVKRLGEQGFVSVSDDINMENYQNMEEFYAIFPAGMRWLRCLMYTGRGISVRGHLFIETGKYSPFM